MSARARATTNPNVTQESIEALLDHMKTLSAAVTRIQTGTGSIDQTQMDTPIASIQGTSPVPKPQPVYPRNPGQVDSSTIIDNDSAVGANRYRYDTAALFLNGFYQTTGKFLDIKTSLAERCDNSVWGSGTGSITEVMVGPKNCDLFHEYGQFTVKELTAHIKVYVDANNQRADQNSEMLATSILASVSAVTRVELHAIYNDFKIGGMVYGGLVFKGLMNKAIVDNKQTTRYLQDQYDGRLSY